MTQQPIFTESEKVELKQKLNDSLPKEIVAFLNTNGGTVFIGVEDNSTICGVENLDDNLKKIADIIDDQIMPDARQFIELGTKYIDNKHIIEIKIQKGNALFYIKKYGRSSQGCFVRSGSTSRAMSEKQINIVIFIVNCNPFLSCNETKICSHLTKKLFHFCKNCIFQIFFWICVM